jgi:hypothetical protein
MSVELPLPGLVDIRQPIVGDSYGWDGVEPTPAKKSIVFHHSASNASSEDGFSIAEYHVHHNGWGGIGYHFVITRSDYPGRVGVTPAGAQIQYVGDLQTWRAHVANQNPGRVGVCFVGMEPDEAQLRLGRQLMDFLVAPNNILPSINFMSQATVHQLVPGQSTSCPGDTFHQWLPFLQGGAFPAALFPPAQPVIPETPIVPDPPLPTPTPETPVPVSDLTPAGKGGGTVIPVTVQPAEYAATYREQIATKLIQRPDAVAMSIPALTPIETSRERLIVGGSVEVAGYFDFQGRTYARTVYSATHNLWNGVDTIYFDLPTGQPNGPVAISTPEVANPAPDPIVIPDPTAVAVNVSDQQLHEATVPPTPKANVWQKLEEFIASLLALMIKKKGSK